MERAHKIEPDLEGERRCERCGAVLQAGEQSCSVCQHDGMDPQEFAELFWDEV